MPILLNPQMMRQIIMDHYENPQHKHPKNDEKPYKEIRMNSASCIDDITVYLLEENGTIKDCFFDGVACTISTASTDIMCNLVIGKSLKEAEYIMDQYVAMIHEQPFDESVLDEAVVFVNTSKQAARIKCATIGWDGLSNLIKK